MPRYATGEGRVKLAAGWLIDRCGWRCSRLGPAGIHERQARVVVNHGGTVLTRQSIDFGGADKIDLTKDTSPNFLGGSMRVHDFMAASMDELRQYSEEPQLGGM